MLMNNDSRLAAKMVVGTNGYTLEKTLLTAIWNETEPASHHFRYNAPPEREAQTESYIASNGPITRTEPRTQADKTAE